MLERFKGADVFSRSGRLIVGAGLLFVTSVVATQCSKAPASDSHTSAAARPATAPAAIGADSGTSRLLGPMSPVVSVKELMRYMIDPISDNIFDAVWWDTTKTGVVKHQPQTPDDWERVKIGAITLAEGIYLLKIPRPFAPAGDVNNSTGPHPPELSPAEIQAKLEKDPVLWDAKIEAMRNAALEIVEVLKQRNADALFAASEDVNEACENCHLEYWYPGDAAAVREYKSGRGRVEKRGAAESRGITK